MSNPWKAVSLVLGGILLGCGAGAGVQAAIAQAPPAPSQRTVVLDVQRAVLESDEGAKAQATVKKLFDKHQHELDAGTQDLQRRKEDLDRRAPTMSKEAAQKERDQWQRDMSDLHAEFDAYQDDLKKRQSELTDPLLKLVLAVAADLAKSKGYDLVVDRQAVPYAKAELDITAEATAALNAKQRAAHP